MARKSCNNNNTTHRATTKGRAETKDKDQIGGGLVCLGELLADVLLGDVGQTGMQNIHNLCGCGVCQKMLLFRIGAKVWCVCCS